MKTNRLLYGGSLSVPLLRMELGGGSVAHDVTRYLNSLKVMDKIGYGIFNYCFRCES